MRQRDAVDSAEMAYHAATRISRIAEDLLTRGALRFGQMHLYGFVVFSVEIL